MLDTKSYKTKTIIKPRRNPSVEGYWCIALDIGYSAVKGFSDNSIFCFPSYARKIEGNLLNLGETSPNEITYRDNATGEIWAVGESAQNMIASDETNDSTAALYGRNRYYSDMFKVILRTGLGLGVSKNEFGSPEKKILSIQTGLPPAYIKSDAALIKDVMSGTHDFALKVGSGGWTNYKLTIVENRINIMPQPMGTLFSISTDKNGEFVPEANKYFSSNIVILDPGFGTLDVFCIKNNAINSHETFSDLGMKRVLTDTANQIFKQYGQEVQVPAFQKYLAAGTIRCFDRKTRSTKEVPFHDILGQVSKNVCMEALNKIDNIYNSLLDYDYLVVTGGTGAAWKHLIYDYYKNMSSLTVISGSKNDELPMFFSNVRGYYLFLYNDIKRKSGG